jgi:tetratricopeptide (TPR) repeat protein
VDWNATVRKLEKALARDPRSWLFMPLAEAHRELGHFNRATELFQAGIAHHPGYLRARVGLARTYILMGRIEEARQELHQAISLAPDNALARRLLAELYLKEGQTERAAAEIRALLRHQPDSPALAQELERILAQAASEAAAPRQARARGVWASPLPVAPPVEPGGPPLAEAVPPAIRGSATTEEDAAVSGRGAEPIFNPGVGVAASRRAELEALKSDAAGSEAGREAELFDAIFDLPRPAAAVGLLSIERVLQEFFPGAFPPAEIAAGVEAVEPAGALGPVGTAAAAGDEAIEELLDVPEAAPAAAAIRLETGSATAADSVAGPLIGAAAGVAALAPIAGDADAEAAVAQPPPIQTLSLVELYVEQGFVAEAREILEQMVRIDPRNPQLLKRLESLRAAASEPESAGEVLKRWLAAIQTVKAERRLQVLV